MALNPGAAVLSLKGFPLAPQAHHTLAFPCSLQWPHPHSSVGLPLLGHLLNMAVLRILCPLSTLTFSCRTVFYSRGFDDHRSGRVSWGKRWLPNLYHQPKSLCWIMNFCVQWAMGKSNSYCYPPPPFLPPFVPRFFQWMVSKPTQLPKPEMECHPQLLSPSPLSANPPLPSAGLTSFMFLEWVHFSPFPMLLHIPTQATIISCLLYGLLAF